MSVWLTIPSARPAAEVRKTMNVWREMGYYICLLRDSFEKECTGAHLTLSAEDIGGYPGYSKSCNYCVKVIMELSPRARWFICAGDDTLPDPNKKAHVIAEECEKYFVDLFADVRGMWPMAKMHPMIYESLSDRRDLSDGFGGTFGVMQPTGDRWGDDAASRKRFGEDRGAYIDRVAGSAWIGREFVRRTYGGNGPMWPEYFHMFNDEELQQVAEKLGVFWQRRDLTHFHQHCQREEVIGQGHGPRPEFLEKAYSRENWNAMKAIYESRKAAGFPGAFEGVSA